MQFETLLLHTHTQYIIINYKKFKNDINKQNGYVVMITGRGKIQILLSHTTALSWGVSSGKLKTTSTNPKFNTYGKHGLHWFLIGIRKKIC